MNYYNQVSFTILIGTLLVSARATACLPPGKAYSITGDSIESTLTTIDHTSVAPCSTLKTINLFNAGNYLMLECQLNGKSAFFMLDTGASFTVLHSKFARHYGYQVVERKGQQTTGFGGNQSTVEIAIGANLNFGAKDITMGFLAQDLTKMIRLIQLSSNVRIAGIIGTDLLKRLDCRINLQHKVMSFEE